jgi:nitrate reductase NapAB chaperone NapD
VQQEQVQLGEMVLKVEILFLIVSHQLVVVMVAESLVTQLTLMPEVQEVQEVVLIIMVVEQLQVVP